MSTYLRFLLVTASIMPAGFLRLSPAAADDPAPKPVPSIVETQKLIAHTAALKAATDDLAALRKVGEGQIATAKQLLEAGVAEEKAAFERVQDVMKAVPDHSRESFAREAFVLSKSKFLLQALSQKSKERASRVEDMIAIQGIIDEKARAATDKRWTLRVTYCNLLKKFDELDEVGSRELRPLLALAVSELGNAESHLAEVIVADIPRDDMLGDCDSGVTSLGAMGWRKKHELELGNLQGGMGSDVSVADVVTFLSAQLAKPAMRKVALEVLLTYPAITKTQLLTWIVDPNPPLTPEEIRRVTFVVTTIGEPARDAMAALVKHDNHDVQAIAAEGLVVLAGNAKNKKALMSVLKELLDDRTVSPVAHDRLTRAVALVVGSTGPAATPVAATAKSVPDASAATATGGTNAP